MPRRKAIKLLPHERQVLVDLYLHFRIPIDQYEGRPNDLAAFVDRWHQLTGRSDSSGELIHYMIVKRKQKLWVTLDGNHRPPPAPPELSADDKEILVTIFRDYVATLQHCSDVLAYDEQLADLVAREFAERTGRIVPAYQLIVALTALRKRGKLDRIEPIDDDDVGFGDIDEAAGQ